MGYDDKTGGWIEVITGPMFAGKSEELLRRINRLKYAKKNFLVFKPNIEYFKIYYSRFGCCMH